MSYDHFLMLMNCSLVLYGTCSKMIVNLYGMSLRTGIKPWNFGLVNEFSTTELTLLQYHIILGWIVFSASRHCICDH